MEIERLAAAVHRAVVTQHPLEDGSYPPAVRTAATRYTLACRSCGETWAALGERVPISVATLRKWALSSEAADVAPTQMVRVEVPSPERLGVLDRPVLVSPAGFRIEGLSVEGAVLALRMLG